MKTELTKSNILIIVALLAFFIIGVYLASVLIYKRSELPPNFFSCGKQAVPFRANISDCLFFRILPDSESLATTLANPTASQVAILVDPNSTASIGVSAYDIYKVYKSLEPRTSIVPGIAYTQHWPEQPIIPNITIDSATFKSPIIWLRLNQTENEIVVDGPRVYVNANSEYDLDAAACSIGINLIKKIMKC